MASITHHVVRRRFGDGPTVALNARGDVVPPGEGCAPYGAGPRTVLEPNAERADEHLAPEDLRRATKDVARALRDLLG